jgi:hypothetical protein
MQALVLPGLFRQRVKLEPPNALELSKILRSLQDEVPPQAAVGPAFLAGFVPDVLTGIPMVFQGFNELLVRPRLPDSFCCGPLLSLKVPAWPATRGWATTSI